MPALERTCPNCGSRFAASVRFCSNDGTELQDAPDPYVGQELLGQFRIESLIGSGGMGSVYRAHQRGVERKVAIKVLHGDLTSNADAVMRFAREAKVAASIDHPNVVRVLLYGELPDGNGYIAMEFLEGNSLADELKNDGAMNVVRAVHITSQICAGVGEAHVHGIVHRDIKPENVFLVRRGTDPDFVKVLDFGVARLLQNDASSATQTGLVFGTAHYISPEGASGEPTDARSDVYSICALLFQLLTGMRPFEGPTPVAILLKHIQDPAPDVRTFPRGASVPEPIASVVARGLSKKAEDRYENARALRDALLRAAAVAGIDASSISNRMPRASRTSIASALATASESEIPAPVVVAQDPSFVSIAGLPTKRTSPWKKAVLAFMLSAIAVFAGFGLYRSASSSASNAETREIINKARAALERDAIDAPEGSSALFYIAELQRVSPGHRAITYLREDAVRHLCESAARALLQDYLDEAERDYNRALAIDPNDPIAKEGMANIARRRAGQPIIPPATPPPASHNDKRTPAKTRPRTPVVGVGVGRASVPAADGDTDTNTDTVAPPSTIDTPAAQDPPQQQQPLEWTTPSEQPTIDWNVPQ